MALPRLDRALRQRDMFADADDSLEDARRATAQLFLKQLFDNPQGDCLGDFLAAVGALHVPPGTFRGSLTLR